MEQFFALAVKREDAQSAGYVGMITADSFMKREFGKKLIEQFIPRWNEVRKYSPKHLPSCCCLRTLRKTNTWRWSAYSTVPLRAFG